VTELSVHAEIDAFEVVDNCLVFGGVPITELAAAVGSTPFYAYDRARVERRIRKLRMALPDEIALHYAIKANPMPALVDFIRHQVDGLDVASVAEMHVALDSGMHPAEISFAGPGKSPAELAEAVAAGITITLESATEMRRVAEIGAAEGISPRVAVRVNPDFELKSSGMRMSGGPKQFGVDAEQVPAMLAELASLQLDFVGFHIFCGSQNLSVDAIVETQQSTIDLALQLMDSAPRAPEFINIGGGFGIPYFPGDKALELDPIGEALYPHVERVRNEIGSKTQLVLELGRYIVGEAGIYVCKVLDRKVSRGTVFLVTDGGLHHHLAASGNFGQVLRKNYPVVLGNRIDDENRESQMVVGPLCTPLDLLGASMDLPPGRIDDLVVVFQSGAYGYTASPHLFLSHPPPKEIIV
jgi:diaminopimelate decarboxylase